jgi:mono/diheme cytochrome c family protein
MNPRIALPALAIGLIALAQPALSQKSAAKNVKPTAAQIANGKQVYEKWCAPCHAANPRFAGTMALQHKYQGKIPAVLEERTDLTPEIVASFVRNGVAWMAPFRKTEVSDAELADIGAYLSKPAQKGKK